MKENNRFIVSSTIILIMIFLLTGQHLFAQQYHIKGRVTDVETGEGLPFVSVGFAGTSEGTATDFDGFYSLKTNVLKDSLQALYLGYLTRTKPVNKNLSTQTINFQLQPDSYVLDEIVVTVKENPAFAIMRKVIDNKPKNDKRAFSAYEYESYNKIEISIDNLSDKFRQRKVMQKIATVFDSLQVIAGDDGKPILPVFISESVSQYHKKYNPDKTKEIIEVVHVTGVGMEDGSLVSQLIGSSFQEYNFYQNWLNIVEKDFISPIADGWNGFYEYELQDSLFVGSNWCYKIGVKPKRPQDLAFSGTIWIADSTFALKQIDVMIGKTANINYIEKIKIP